jgi:plastocyanin
MKGINTITLSFILILSGLVLAQTSDTVVTTNDNQFSPKNVTIDLGDTIVWYNASGGNHNVVADDNSFTSGAPSTDHWIYAHVILQPGFHPYYCQVHGQPGGVGMSGTITVSPPTHVKEKNIHANSFYLKQNYPNPFNPSTKIEFSIPKGNFTELTVYNSIGVEVSALISKYLNAGVYTVEWDPHNLSSGIYFYSIKSGNFSTVRKMVLLK